MVLGWFVWGCVCCGVGGVGFVVVVFVGSVFRVHGVGGVVCGFFGWGFFVGVVVGCVCAVCGCACWRVELWVMLLRCVVVAGCEVVLIFFCVVARLGLVQVVVV
ncbi:hypothetical protein, partial [Pseudomonas syringae group genomosp. 7]|uniref:hypothetical protein n=1 Tax=Pseudomonas syringae group genomosp. 7 TaxID=251699 RepID=UPI00376FF490